MDNYTEFKDHVNVTSVCSQTLRAVAVFWLLILSLAVTAFNAYAQSSASEGEKKAPIRLGLIPHLSTQIMMKKYRPLITYLQEEMNQPVIAITSPNFKTYVQRVEKGEFNIYMTAPSMAAYHEKHNKHARLAKFTQQLQGVIVVAEDSPYKTLLDLKGKSIAAPDELAVITSLGEVTFKDNGIDPKKDINIKYTPSHNNALQSVVADKADGAILGYPAYKIITSSSKLRKPVRILIKTKVIPHMMFMSPPNVSIEEQEKLQLAMLKFPSTDAGEKFFSGVPFKSIDVITDEDMLRLEGVLLILEQHLNN